MSDEFNALDEAQPGVGVAEEEPADLTEDVPEGMARCVECGKIVSARGLGVHRAKVHGVPDRTKTKLKKKRDGGRKLAARTGDALTAKAVGEIFAAVVGELQGSAQLMQACVDGLECVLAEAKVLRETYIKRAHKLLQLRAEIEELRGRRAKVAD